jgi:hypothetical protein
MEACSTMKRMLTTALLGVVVAGIAGCVYDPGYVRSDGYYSRTYYDDGYYGGRAYYDPYYSGYYYPGYYGPTIGLGFSYRDYHGHGGRYRHDGGHHWSGDGGHHWSGNHGTHGGDHGRGGTHDRGSHDGRH